MYALAAGMAAVGATASLATAPNAFGICGAGLALLMAAIAAIDARHFIIPDQLNAAALILALVHAGVEHNEIDLGGMARALMRAATLSLLFLGLRITYRRLRNRDGLGLGDVKLAGVAGAWLGWQTFRLPSRQPPSPLLPLTPSVVAFPATRSTQGAVCRSDFFWRRPSGSAGSWRQCRPRSFEAAGRATPWAKCQMSHALRLRCCL
jgi:Type IV leader peptidase family